MRVLIAGGGITGLTAARALGRAGAECLLVEADARLGGKILTTRDDGCLVEGGPDAFIAVKPAAAQLCRELGLGDRLVGTDPTHNRTFVLRGGHLLEMPGGLTTFVPTRWGPFLKSRLISLPGKLRMGLEYFVPARPGEDESMASFFRRRLGTEAWRWMVEPLLSGIYAGDGAELGLAATFPRFLEMERASGGLLRASLAARRAGPGPGGTSMFQSLQGGLSELVDGLAAEVRGAGVRVALQTRLERLEWADGGVQARLSDGTTWDGDFAALCLPAFAAAELLQERAPELAAELRGIPYVSTATVTLALDAAAAPFDGYGFVVPRAEGRAILACTWTTSKWLARASQGTALVRCYLGGAGREEVLAGADDALADLAWREVADIMRLSASPRRAWVHRWPRAMPQYRVGHPGRVRRIEELAAAIPGLALAGAAYRGVGIPDCIADGGRMAEALLQTAG